MAFCGVKFSEEEKVGSNVDRSLRNVWAFSTSKSQACPTSKEEGLERDKKGKLVDRRIKIIYSQHKFNLLSYTGLTQLTAKLPNGKTYVGSCSGINVRNGSYILTAAHNLVRWNSRTGKFVNFESMFAYRSRQGENLWRACNPISQEHVHVHPKHNGHSDCGFDIAIARKMKLESWDRNTVSFCPRKSRIVDSVWGNVNPKKLKKGMSVEVAGYPGEKEGHPHTHSGMIADVTETPLGGWLIWYDVDCTPGNSGSSIMITDENFVKSQMCTPSVRKIIIGVHTGFEPSEGLNFGTLITPSIKKWLETGKV